jgi:large subunit ribosomal protein L29
VKPSEIREKSKVELNEELVALKEELFRLRFQHATNQLENPLKLRTVKRDMARVRTILRERELKGINE